jgi:hypothetical protein
MNKCQGLRIPGLPGRRILTFQESAVVKANEVETELLAWQELPTGDEPRCIVYILAVQFRKRNGGQKKMGGTYKRSEILVEISEDRDG